MMQICIAGNAYSSASLCEMGLLKPAGIFRKLLKSNYLPGMQPDMPQTGKA
jgi:hypothetical protein